MLRLLLSHADNLTAMKAMLAILGMATLTIRNLPNEVYQRLRIRAAENKRSMEAEVRELVSKALTPKVPIAETLQRIDAMMAELPKNSRDKFSVDSFLADRRALWGEDR